MAVPDRFENNVFINCPFDDGYTELLRPLIFTVLFFKMNPRISLEESDSGQERITKIKQLIKESKYSIHDLSRVQSSKKGEYYRLNMPFELGVDFGSRHFTSSKLKEKIFLILEKEPHQYKIALSDLSGIDIKYHKNEPAELIRCVRNWFVENLRLKKVIGAEAIWYKYNDIWAFIFDDLIAKGFSQKDVDTLPMNEFIDYVKKYL